MKVEARWPSWAFRPNGFRGRKAILNRASALVSIFPNISADIRGHEALLYHRHGCCRDTCGSFVRRAERRSGGPSGNSAAPATTRAYFAWTDDTQFISKGLKNELTISVTIVGATQVKPTESQKDSTRQDTSHHL